MTILPAAFAKVMTTTNTRTEIGIFEDTSNRLAAPIELRGRVTVECADDSADDSAIDGVLDQLASTIGWTFLYLPGIAAIHFCVLLQALFAAQGEWPPNMVAGSVGSIILGAFMMMLGLGKLSDLRFLKAVGAALASSILLAVIYTFFTISISADSFGWFALLTLPITMLLTNYVKQKLENGEAL